MISNETYFEFDEDLHQGFTTIPNYILNDTRLTFKAVGVYVQILQYKNTGKHKIYLKSLSNYRQDRKTAVASALKELEEYGYISREYIRNDRGHMKGMKYVVRMKPIDINIENTTNSPKSENLKSANLQSDFTTLINKISNKENVLKENDVDVVDSQTDKVIALYKSFKVEKRAMPQTINMLSKYTDKISIEVFEYIFIQAAEDSVKKKYSYMKSILDKLYENKIFTMTDLEKYNNDFKDENTKKEYKSKKTRLHNHKQTFTKYSETELEEVCKQSQLGKLEEEKAIEQDIKKSEIPNYAELYEIALQNGFSSFDTRLKLETISYSKKNNLFIPTSWKCDK